MGAGFQANLLISVPTPTKIATWSALNKGEFTLPRLKTTLHLHSLWFPGVVSALSSTG